MPKSRDRVVAVTPSEFILILSDPINPTDPEEYRELRFRIPGYAKTDAFVGLRSSAEQSTWEPEHGNVGTEVTHHELIQLRDWLNTLDLERPLPDEQGLYQVAHGSPIQHEVTYRRSNAGWLNALDNRPAEEDAKAAHNGPRGPLVRLVRPSA